MKLLDKIFATAFIISIFSPFIFMKHETVVYSALRKTETYHTPRIELTLVPIVVVAIYIIVKVWMSKPSNHD